MNRLFLLLFFSVRLIASGCFPDFCKLTSRADSSVKCLGLDSAGQLLVGQLVQAINSELILLDLLIAGKTGAVINEKIIDRHTILNKTDPLVIDAYCNIMEVATYSKALIKQCYHNQNCIDPCPARLSCKDRSCFLHRIRYVLGCYQQRLRQFQCKISCQSECL